MGHEIGKKSRVAAGTTALIAAAGLAGVALSHAAGSPVMDGPTILGAGVAATETCSSDTLTITPGLRYEPAEGTYLIHEVTVTGVPPECVGQRLRLTLDGRPDGSERIELEAIVASPTTVLPVPPAQRPAVGAVTSIAAVVA